MRIKEIIERIQRLPDGGIITDENRWDEDFLESIINTFRLVVIRDSYNKNNKRINPSCYQKYYCVYDADIQEDGMIKFFHPPVTSMDGFSDGFRYIGSSEGSEDFRRITSRAKLSLYNNHKVMSVKSGRNTTVLYDGNSEYLEVYGNQLIRECLTESILLNPMDSQYYNKKTDQYPIGDDMIPMLEDYIFRAQTSIESSRNPDVVSSSSEIPAQQIQTKR